MKHTWLSVTALTMMLSLHAASEINNNSTDQEQEIVEGDLFIVPNSLRYVGTKGPQEYPEITDNMKMRLQPHNVLVEVWATSRDDEGNTTPEQFLTSKESVPTDPAASSKDNWRSYATRMPHTHRIELPQNKSDNWNRHSHPILGNVFPSHLPLYMLENKQEGDVLRLPIKTQNGRLITLVLRCKQNGYRYGSHRFGYDFAQMVTILKEGFHRSPNYAISDIKFLVRNKILVPNPNYQRERDRGNWRAENYFHGPAGFSGTDKNPDAETAK